MNHTKTAAITLALCALSPLFFAPAAQAATDGRYTLEKVVTLSRHGVRPPTDGEKLNKATGKSWGGWNVADGQLSGHGYAGIVNQSAWRVAQWRNAGLPLGANCPPPQRVFVWSSPLQRTRATAQALLDGMFPGCGLAAGFSRQKLDPLFQSVDMGLARPDLERAKQQVIARMGGSEAAAAARYRPAIQLMRSAVCADDGQACQFLNAPWKLVAKENSLSLKGPLSPGASIGETIRLQYSEGLPLSQVAFGHAANASQVAALMALHAAKYDLLSDTPELARHGGTLLMGQLAAALAQGTPLEKSPTESLRAPLVMFVGHDTNIAQIQTMLDFNWTLGEYPANDIPPGGTLAFERYRDRQSGELFVRLSFSALSLDQWRGLSRLNGADTPLSADYRDEACRTTPMGTLCPLRPMLEKMAAAQVGDIVSPRPLYQ
ncbi:histidine-type phosphatase [Affinibrenneria salicis]|uniref:Histidine-type phosphatase n=1 Tax=Affinibrenneria salicis TaxID=2590031 RepID=A0A5J5FY99_9GAMM|nr:histidine-type phosphatase [Affinibrenneria salicis]KAA8998929.1 histidine-type phosphatase [Affinibrenneria salicis]